jgi:hypothetical protein
MTGWDGWMNPQYNQWVEQPDQAAPGGQPAAGQPDAEQPATPPAEQPGQAP